MPDAAESAVGAWGQMVWAAWASRWRSPCFWRRSRTISPTASNSSARSCGFLPKTSPRRPFPRADRRLAQASRLEHVRLATAVAGLVGTLVVFGVGLGDGAESCRVPRTTRPPPMRLEGLERYSAGTGPLHRLDARIKLIAALCSVVVVVATPIGAWRHWEPWARSGLRHRPGRHSATRAGAALAGVSSCWSGSWRSWSRRHTRRARARLAVVAASILIKNSLALLTMLVLAGRRRSPSCLPAVRKLGVPLVLVATLQFMDRYRHVLLDELDRMATARRARTFSRRGSLPWSLLTGLIGCCSCGRSNAPSEFTTP